MNSISEVSTRVLSEAQTNYIMNAIAVICGLGVVVLVCLATDGLDMSVGFFYNEPHARRPNNAIEPERTTFTDWG